MAVSADTQNTIPLVVESGGGGKIRFDARFISSRETTKHQGIAARMDSLDFDDPQMPTLAWEAIQIGITGWDQAEPFSLDAIEDKLTRRELVHLAVIYPRHIMLGESDRGKSLSRLTINAGESAASAPSPVSA